MKLVYLHLIFWLLNLYDATLCEDSAAEIQVLLNSYKFIRLKYLDISDTL